MTPGKMRHKGTVQRPVDPDDEFEDGYDFKDVATDVYFSIDPIGGPMRTRERIESQQLHGRTLYTLMTRWTDTLAAMDESWRVVIGSKTYNIQSVLNVQERNRFLDILATSG